MSRLDSQRRARWATLTLSTVAATTMLAACSTTDAAPADEAPSVEAVPQAEEQDTTATPVATYPSLEQGLCEGFTVGLANISTTIPFLAAMGNAFEDEAHRLGMESTVLNANLDNATLVNNVKTLTAQGVDVLLVTSSSPTAPVEAIKAARDADIPVIALNAQLDAEADVATYIGISDYQFGEALGDLAIQALPEGGKIAVIMGPLGGTPQVQRLAGMEAALEGHDGYEIIATPTDDFDNGKNLAATQDLLSKYPAGEIDMIVGQGPQMHVGATWAHQNGREEVLFIAGDYSTQVEDAIRNGVMYGTVNQSPEMEGLLGAAYACQILAGQESQVPAPEALIDLPIITAESVDQFPAEWSG